MGGNGARNSWNASGLVTLALWAALMTLPGCKSTGGAETDLESQSVAVPIAGVLAFEDPVYKRPESKLIWTALEANSERLKALNVDYKHQCVLIHAIGQRRTDGYWAKIQAVRFHSPRYVVPSDKADPIVYDGPTLEYEVTENQPQEESAANPYQTFVTYAVVLPKPSSKPQYLLMRKFEVKGQPSPN